MSVGQVSLAQVDLWVKGCIIWSQKHTRSHLKTLMYNIATEAHMHGYMYRHWSSR